MSELFAVDVAHDFISAIVSHVKKRLSRGSRLTVLFPNRRAVRFFENRLASSAQLRVSAAALEDFAREAVYTLSGSPPVFQCDIDRFFTLHDLLRTHPGLYQRLGGTLERVFPWCIHLSNLFDELDQNLIASVSPLPYIDEVVPEAREILQSLDTIYRDYRHVMDEQNLTYHGDIFRRLNALRDRLEGSFVLAGFALLTEAQKSIFLHLFRHRETAVFFHTDLVGRHPVTNPYRLYDSWQDGTFWGVRPTEHRDATGGSSRPHVTFYESFDTHAETAQLLDALKKSRDLDGPVSSPLDTGVILPDTQTLFPVLYALAGRDDPMNVTLGFPFEKSVFSRLLDTLTELTLTHDNARGFYHAPLLKFLAHPLTRALKVGTHPFRESAERLRMTIVERNLSFVDFNTLPPSPTFTAGDLELSQLLNKEILTPFVKAKNLNEAGEVLTRLIHSFKDTLSHDLEAELERQMVQNFLDRVLPNLVLSRSAKRDLGSPRVLCKVLRHLVAPIHIPFEGNPLEGLQVMGMLESRLLNFTHLFILDVNEGILPKGTKTDPLLPPALNPLVGLPSLKMRDALFRYNFFRLVDGSKDVHVFYQRGITGEDKRIRSRFAEQLLLEEEIRRVEEGTQTPVEALEASLVTTCTLQLPPINRPDPTRPSFYGEKLSMILGEEISPTILDEYLYCPHRFYLHRIVKMAEDRDVQESQSAPDVGNMVHRILNEAFSQALGIPLTSALLEKIRQTALGKIEPHARNAFPALSSLRIKLLIRLTQYRLNTFFAHMKKELATHETLRVTRLENAFHAHLKGLRLSGRIDRVDEIRKTATGPVTWRIVDYKTGRSAKAPAKRIDEFLASFDFSDHSLDALAYLKRALRSIQLPMYLYLFREATPLSEGEEIESTLFSLGNPPGEMIRETFPGDKLSQEQIALVIHYLVTHMRQNTSIAPYTQDHCPHCPYVTVCQHTTRGPASNL